MLQIIISALLILSCISSFAETPEDKTVFSIDGTEIKQSTFRYYYQSKNYKKAKNIDEQKLLNYQTAQELINIYLLSREAERLNLDKSYQVTQELELARKTILMKAMVKKLSEDFKVTENDHNSAYLSMQQNARKKTAFKLRNIVVDDENKAIDIIQQLDEGSDFLSLEKKFSEENFQKGNKAADWLDAEMLEPEMFTAIASLDKQQYTKQPVKTRFGWHVVLVEDKKLPPELPPLKQIRNELNGLIKQKMMREEIDKLRSRASISTSLEKQAK